MKFFIISVFALYFFILLNTSEAQNANNPPDPTNCVILAQDMGVYFSSHVESLCFQITVDFCDRSDDEIRCLENATSLIAKQSRTRLNNINNINNIKIERNVYSEFSYHYTMKRIKTQIESDSCVEERGLAHAICKFLNESQILHDVIYAYNLIENQ